MLTAPKSFPVLGLHVHLLEDYTAWLMEPLRQKVGAHVVTLNAEMAMFSEQNPDLAGIIRQADLIIPDGSGITLYLRWCGIKQPRCPGIELAESLVEQIGQKGDSYPIIFYGGKPGIAEAAAQVWRQKIPGISIITNHGYLSDSEVKAWENSLKQRQPQLILVALGVPRQEFWIQQNRFLCPEAIWIGVGGSFDIWAGQKTRAPKWFRDNSLEWLYRLYQEPWRWRRMLALPQFFWCALWSRK
jgi:N-acetylglucosaminyldiphosphoundecaprenol N-acetyl-beta-D-mannosaminyltransferase